MFKRLASKTFPFAISLGVLLPSTDVLAAPQGARARADATAQRGQLSRQQEERKQERRSLIQSPLFAPSKNLQGKFEFWRLIFSKYGDKQLVFHHRDYPEIVYSVLDMQEFASTFSGKEYAKKVNQATDEETARIKEALLYLADGNSPRTPFQRRLVQLFSHLGGSPRSNYGEAAEDGQIRNQRGVKERFRDGVIRSGRYLHAMERVFELEGLPKELTRLPLVESSFDYTAYSSVGAAGIWQFMRATGKKYMRIDASIDERRDPIFATRAAAKYLAHAYRRLGNWPLALTSYNHGVAGIARAVSETGSTDLGEIIERYDGKAFGFASKNFYAEFMAALHVEQNASYYFPGIQRETPWHFDEVRLARALTFGELVRYSGASSDEVEKLNRALMKPIVSGRVRIGAGSVVKVPSGRGPKLVASLGSGTKLLAFERGTALAEQSFPDRSSDSDSEDSLASNESATELITVRDNVVVERRTASSKSVTPKAVNRKDLPKGREKRSEKKEKVYKVASHKIRSGDTLGGIAKRYNTSVAKLQELNPSLSKKKLKLGAQLVLPAKEIR